MYSSLSATYNPRYELPQEEVHVKDVPFIAVVHRSKTYWPVHSIQVSLSLIVHGPWGLAKTLLYGPAMGWGSGYMAAAATVAAG